jgi:hypothetical protein
VDINYAVLMPPPKRQPKRLQVMLLGGFGVLTLAAIVVAIVLVRSYSPQAATLGSVASTQMAPAAAPEPMAAPAAATPQPTAAAPAAAPEADKAADKAPKKHKRGRGGGRSVKAASAGSAGPSKPATAPKKRDDDLKRLLGI